MKIVTAVAEWRCGSDEIEASYGADEAMQLFDPERAQLSESMGIGGAGTAIARDPE